MPVLEAEFVKTPARTVVTTFGLEPVHNMINSLLLLNKAEKMSEYGYDEWITQTAVSLSDEQRKNNRVVVDGLYYAIVPRRRWSSFTAYIDHLAAGSADRLRQRMFDAYERLGNGEKATLSIEDAMTSADNYLAYLGERFPAEYIDEEAERVSFALLREPEKMRTLIVGHLQSMWEEVLAPEWERKKAMLQASADAFRQLDLAGLSLLETIEQVLERPLPEHWSQHMAELELDEIIFVPSPHLGPYMHKFKAGKVMWLLFGARLPAGSEVSSPDLSRAELLVRLSALADDTRLRMLRLIADEQELCSRDVIEQLDLSQSAASRHLKQLSANGYLSERRVDGAKCYSVNEERVETTAQALSHFILG